MFVASLGEYLVMNVYKYSKAVKSLTVSPKLGCQFQNFKNFGIFFYEHTGTW